MDNHSSAHVYLRLPKGMTIDTIHPDTIQECFQLVKVHDLQLSLSRSLSLSPSLFLCLSPCRVHVPLCFAYCHY